MLLGYAACDIAQNQVCKLDTSRQGQSNYSTKQLNVKRVLLKITTQTVE